MSDILLNDLSNIESLKVGKRFAGVRRYRACVIKSVPDGTTPEELVAMIMKLVDIKGVMSITIVRPEKPKMQIKMSTPGQLEEVFTLQAFLTLIDDEDCKKVVSFFQDYTVTNLGFAITNLMGVKSRIFVHFLYTPDDENFYEKKVVGGNLDEAQQISRMCFCKRLPQSLGSGKLKTALEALGDSVLVENLCVYKGTFEHNNGIVRFQTQEICDFVVERCKKFNRSGSGIPLDESSEIGTFIQYLYNKHDIIHTDGVLFRFCCAARKDFKEMLINEFPEENFDGLNIYKTDIDKVLIQSFHSAEQRDKIIDRFSEGHFFYSKNNNAYFLLPFKYALKTDCRSSKGQKYGTTPSPLCEIVLWNLPEEIESEDVRSLIRKLIPPDAILNVHMLYKTSNTSAIVRLQSMEQCQLVVDSLRKSPTLIQHRPVNANIYIVNEEKLKKYTEIKKELCIKDIGFAIRKTFTKRVFVSPRLLVRKAMEQSS